MGGKWRDEIRSPIWFVMAVVAQKNHVRILERERGESKRSCVYITVARRIEEGTGFGVGDEKRGGTETRPHSTSAGWHRGKLGRSKQRPYRAKPRAGLQ